MLLITILVLSMLSYFVGVRAVLRGEYQPNVYSRIIWLMIAINGLAGLISLKSYISIIVLSAAQTIGSLVMLILSLKYSVFKFGTIEIVASILLFFSVVIWLFGDLPLINVVIGLIAHFIAGIPSLYRVVKNPRSEHTLFWAYFAVASFISLVFLKDMSLKQVIFPAYFLGYNLLMVGLSRRRYS